MCAGFGVILERGGLAPPAGRHAARCSDPGGGNMVLIASSRARSQQRAPWTSFREPGHWYSAARRCSPINLWGGTGFWRGPYRDPRLSSWREVKRMGSPFVLEVEDSANISSGATGVRP